MGLVAVGFNAAGWQQADADTDTNQTASLRFLASAALSLFGLFRISPYRTIPKKMQKMFIALDT